MSQRPNLDRQDAAIAQAALVRRALTPAVTGDARVQTLQQIPAPIAYLDIENPYPLPAHPWWLPVGPLVPMPGDSGAMATAYGLEDK